MAKNKENFYIAKGNNGRTWLYYGINPPIIRNGIPLTFDESFNKICKLIGCIDDNPISDSLKIGDVVKIYIRKETIKNKKNE